MDIHEVDQAYRIKVKDKDDRKTYAKFMKEKGGKAFERYKLDAVDDREEYKNRMKYGKNR
jgi:hypothetical protein